MPGIGVVLNPKSKRNRRDPGAAGRLARYLGPNGTVRTAGSIGELSVIAAEFHQQEIDVLAISGGDGTNTVTLSGFFEEYGSDPLPPVALLRGGTMNTVANSVGVPRGHPDELLKRLVARYAERSHAGLKTVERNMMHVTPAGQSNGGHYGFLFGTGVVHGFLAEYYRGGDPTPFVAARTLARGVGSAIVGGATIRRMASPFRGSVRLEGGTSWPERDYLAVAAGCVAHIGLQFQPFYRFDEQPDCFHVLGIHASPAAFAGQLLRIHRGAAMRPGLAYDAISRRIFVRSANGALKYMIDGDLHEAAPLAEDKVESPQSSVHVCAPYGEVSVAIGPRVRLVVEP